MRALTFRLAGNVQQKRREIGGDGGGGNGGSAPDAGRRTKVTMAKALRASYSRRSFESEQWEGGWKGISGYCSRHDTVKFYGVVPAGSKAAILVISQGKFSTRQLPADRTTEAANYVRRIYRIFPSFFFPHPPPFPTSKRREKPIRFSLGPQIATTWKLNARRFPEPESLRRRRNCAAETERGKRVSPMMVAAIASCQFLRENGVSL